MNIMISSYIDYALMGYVLTCLYSCQCFAPWECMYYPCRKLVYQF